MWPQAIPTIRTMSTNTIVVIDDDPALAEALPLLFERRLSNTHVASYTSPTAALAHLAGHEPARVNGPADGDGGRL